MGRSASSFLSRFPGLANPPADELELRLQELKRRMALPYKTSSKMKRRHFNRENLVELPEEPGVYLMGNYDFERHCDLIHYVGKSGRELQDRMPHGYYKYGVFFFRAVASEMAATIAECIEFHRYGGTARLDNKIHPPMPNGSGTCPTRGCKH